MRRPVQLAVITASLERAQWLEKFNREEGVFSSVDQKIVWTERIPAKEK
ncbi:hypothetical protein [Streptomyces hydrogenans]